MFTHIVKTGLAVSLIATASSGLAQEDPIIARGQPSHIAKIYVPYADLDIIKDDGRKMLVSRVRLASRDVCKIAYDKQLWDFQGRNDCASDSFQRASKDIRAAIVRRRAQSLAGLPASGHIVLAVQTARVR